MTFYEAYYLAKSRPMKAGLKQAGDNIMCWVSHTGDVVFYDDVGQAVVAELTKADLESNKWDVFYGTGEEEEYYG